jgi:hypothetical protein
LFSETRLTKHCKWALLGWSFKPAYRLEIPASDRHGGCPTSSLRVALRTRSRGARRWWDLLRVVGTISPSAALCGWRRSADRTCLQLNSLLTGNFTGKIAFFAFQRQSRNHKSPSIRRFLSIFLTRIIREIGSRNSEFSGSSRELGPNIRLDVQLFSEQLRGASNGGFAPASGHLGWPSARPFRANKRHRSRMLAQSAGIVN